MTRDHDPNAARFFVVVCVLLPALLGVLSDWWAQ